MHVVLLSRDEVWIVEVDVTGGMGAGLDFGEPPDLGLTVARREHRNGRIVGVQLACRQDVIANSFYQRSNDRALSTCLRYPAPP